MNLEIFKCGEPSGKYYRKEYLEKFHNEELECVLNYSQEKKIENIPFKEMVYLFINKLSGVPKCKNINCPNVVKFKNSTLGYYDFCSNKCSTSDVEVLKKKVETNIKKFGTKTPAESIGVREKSKETCQEKYGGNSPMSDKNIQEKSKKTLMTNYGVDNPNKSEILKERRIESFKENIESYKENYKNTSLERYGVDHPWKNKEIHKKCISTTEGIKNDNLTEVVKYRLDGDNLINIDYKFRVITASCKYDHIYKISRHQLYRRHNAKTVICTICNPIDRHISGQEIGIINFIKDNYSGEIITNCRDIISPLEIDIYMPSLKLGVEFNGLYWHSEEKRGKSYHNDKYLKSVENGITLIQIWEDDWFYKREIVESFILNKLKKSNRIYARKCIIKEITSKESSKFLNENHLQGDCKSFAKIGLFYNDELVSFMCFSKLRISLSQKDKEGYCELSRFCNKIGNTVVGGASKIFKYFLNKYNPKSIISYSDNSISNGNLYKELGFEFSGYTPIGYWYVVNDVRDHRFNWRKGVLVKLGYDKNKTEEQIMEELGYWRIYNSGNKRWVCEFNK